jgi:hypothetical protein
MTSHIFRDRRIPGERRNKRNFAGRIHCRRQSRERRRYQCESDSRRWWLKINYVDREMIVDKTPPYKH